MMKISLVAGLLLYLGQHSCADDQKVREALNGSNYAVTWEKPKEMPSDTEIEIGHGHGHGDTLEWLRFKPSKNAVDVISICYDEGSESYKGLPPDRATVTTKHAQMKSDSYSRLLNDLAIVESAKLNRENSSREHSTSNFWVSSQMLQSAKKISRLDYAGYESPYEEVNYAKPKLVVKLVRGIADKLEFKDYVLSTGDRKWASEKFARDWAAYKDLQGYSWVRARYIVTIGYVGNISALPTLRDILIENKQGIYYAINAVTRIVDKDVRIKPIECNNLEKSRLLVLDLIKDK